jgi:AI-2 transport protein TqsA
VKNDKFLKFGMAVIVLFIAGIFLRLAKPVLVPFSLALFLSFVISPILDFLTRRRIPRPLAVVILLLLTFALLYLLGVMFYASGKSFAVELPAYGNKLKSMVDDVEKMFGLDQFKGDPLGWLREIEIARIGTIFFASLGPFFGFVGDLFLIFLFLIFILAGRGRLKRKIPRAFEAGDATRVAETIQKIDRQIQKYLALHTLISAVTGFLATVTLLLFGLPFAVVFGFITFLLNYIPNFGSVIATALPALLAVFHFGRIWPAFWVLVVLIGIQMTLGNFIEPRLMGRELGLSPLLVIFSLIFGGWLWGFPGMIIAVPVLASFKIAFGNIPSLAFLDVMMDK